MPGKERDFMTPSSSEDVARETEIMLLRAMTRTMESLASQVEASRNDIGDIKTKVAVIEERQSQNSELRENIATLRTDIDHLKARNDKQDGAMDGLTFLKSFGPWIVSLLVLAWGLLGTRK